MLFFITASPVVHIWLDFCFWPWKTLNGQAFKTPNFSNILSGKGITPYIKCWLHAQRWSICSIVANLGYVGWINNLLKKSHGILAIADKPKSLQSICRVTIRRTVGRQRLKHLDTLPVPLKLYSFLAYADVIPNVEECMATWSSEILTCHILLWRYCRPS